MGTEYKNSIINDLCKYLKIKNITSTAHHHLTEKNIPYTASTPSMAHDYCPYELGFGKTTNLRKQLFVPNRSRHFRVTPRDKGVIGAGTGTLCWQDDRGAAMVTMVTALPDHRRCGTALR